MNGMVLILKYEDNIGPRCVIASLLFHSHNGSCDPLTLRRWNDCCCMVGGESPTLKEGGPYVCHEPRTTSLRSHRAVTWECA